MTRTHVKQSLKALHDELHQHPQLDDEAKELLRVVLHDIQGALDEGRPHKAAVVDDLEAQALSFEQRHPKLTEAVRAVVEALRQAGV
jgi:hypothetical protein